MKESYLPYMERIFSLSSRSTYFFFLDFSHVKCINLLNNCNYLSIFFFSALLTVFTIYRMTSTG